MSSYAGALPFELPVLELPVLELPVPELPVPELELLLSVVSVRGVRRPA